MKVCARLLPAPHNFLSVNAKVTTTATMVNVSPFYAVKSTPMANVRKEKNA